MRRQLSTPEESPATDPPKFKFKFKHVSVNAKTATSCSISQRNKSLGERMYIQQTASYYLLDYTK